MTLFVTVTDTVFAWEIVKFTVTPALTFVFTCMARPPYGVGTCMGLVTGLGPFRSAVALEIALARTSAEPLPFWTTTRASSSGRTLQL